MYAATWATRRAYDRPPSSRQFRPRPIASAAAVAITDAVRPSAVSLPSTVGGAITTAASPSTASSSELHASASAAARIATTITAPHTTFGPSRWYPRLAA